MPTIKFFTSLIFSVPTCCIVIHFHQKPHQQQQWQWTKSYVKYCFYFARAKVTKISSTEKFPQPALGPAQPLHPVNASSSECWMFGSKLDQNGMKSGSGHWLELGLSSAAGSGDLGGGEGGCWTGGCDKEDFIKSAKYCCSGNKIVVASVPKRKLSDLKSELVSARSFPQTSNYHRNQITNGHNWKHSLPPPDPDIKWW